MNLCVIPARGGSKRIRKKNIKHFAGKPLLAHSIEAAQSSTLFEEVIVSTDDEEIATVARELGASVPFMRPHSLSDDFTGTGLVVAHAIEECGKSGLLPDFVCCIYATAPMLDSNDVAKGLHLLQSGEWSYVFSATSFESSVFRGFMQLHHGGLEMLFPEHADTRSQDLSEIYHDAGQFYWGRRQSWLDGEPVFGTHSTIVKLPRWRVQDIDTEEDWTRAELMYRAVLPS